jgi:hypothetical protein
MSDQPKARRSPLIPRRFYYCLAILAGGAFFVGCTGTWRSDKRNVDSSQPVPAERLAHCLQANRIGRWIYHRYEYPINKDESPQQYVRIRTGDRMVEGLLVGKEIPSLHGLLEAQATRAESKSKPPLSFGKKMTIYWEVEQALPTIPPSLGQEKRAVAETTLRYYDYLGRLGAQGTVTRGAVLEGMEDITCPAGTFKDCLRVRVEIDVRFPWIFQSDLTTIAWLSPEVGEVRRIQHLTGWFLIFWFGSAQEYELISGFPAIQQEANVPLTEIEPVNWKTGLMVFDRGYPHVRIGGMLVDFADSGVGGDDAFTNKDYDQASSTSEAADNPK